MSPGLSDLVGHELLVFTSGQSFFAIDLGLVVQIIDYEKPAIPPRKPLHAEGVIEFRNHYIPLISLRKWLGLEESEVTANPVILIVRLGDGHCGLSVDSVTRILSQNLEEVTEPPPKVQGVRSEYLKGVFNFNGKPLLWINVDSLSGLSGEDFPIATSQ